METETLNQHQIKMWREVIAIRLDSMSPGAGIYASIMSESEVVAYWEKMKNILENPPSSMTGQFKTCKFQVKKPCDHSNSIVGQNGKYCIDCEKYV